MCVLVAPPGPGVIRMVPAASTVCGWQVVQVASVIAGLWLAVAGGMPWQLPHAALPVVVHTGRAAPWHHALAQVAVPRSQPSATVTSAGGGESMCPGSPTSSGTR